MIIYYISKTNSLKRPVDIQQSGIHILNNGDICIRTHNEITSLILVNNISKFWSENRVIASVKIKMQLDPGNTLLYSYDGFNRRYGHIHLLSQLLDIFQDRRSITEFIHEAINILKYKRDTFSYNILSKIYYEEPKNDNNISEPHVVSRECVISPLSPFLPTSINNQLTEFIEAGLTLYESYCKIKKIFPLEFINACREYVRVYPGKGIY